MIIAISTASGATWRATPTAPRTVLLFVIVAAAIAGFMATGADATSAALTESGADLTRLLRAMAAIKIAMAACAAASVVWRLGSPVSFKWFAGYALACAAMAAGPGLIWDIAHVAAGAALLHAGLFATIVLLWRDPAVGARLAAVVATRRARRA